MRRTRHCWEEEELTVRFTAQAARKSLKNAGRFVVSRFPEGLPTGEAVITSGGNLPAPYVIHTVGPIRGAEGGRDAELLAACYWNSLALAVQHNLSSVAFPSISTGAYGYPREEAAAVSSRAIEDFLTADNTLKAVRLVFYAMGDARLFLNNHKLRNSS